MKTPVKPFVVEVRRSRRSVPVPSNARSEPFLPVETLAPSAAGEASAARQAAEQLFKGLLSAPSSNEGPVLMADSVFGPVAETQVQEASPMPSVTEVNQPAAVSVDPGRIDIKGPARPARKRASRKNAKADGSRTAAKTLPVLGSPKPATETPGLLPVRLKVEPSTTSSSRTDEAIPNAKRRDWKSGERWKRRLRHMR